MRYFIEFAYKGTHYHGSQIQPNGVTVQSVLQDAFFTILRTPVALTFAGRTDAGVHAKQMFAHFDLPDSDSDPTASAVSQLSGLTSRLNRLLPEDIAVYRIFPVADDLHARAPTSTALLPANRPSRTARARTCPYLLTMMLCTWQHNACSAHTILLRSANCTPMPSLPIVS